MKTWRERQEDREHAWARVVIIDQAGALGDHLVNRLADLSTNSWNDDLSTVTIQEVQRTLVKLFVLTVIAAKLRRPDACKGGAR